MSVCWKFCLACLLLSACQSSTSEEHLEHHVPPHQPPNYPAAVHALHERLHELEDAAADADTRLAEFRDILGWLPELAANSDLGQGDWDEINAITRQLRELWAGVSSLPASAEVSRRSHELIEKLEGFEDKSPFDNLPGHLTHGHNHDHGHNHH